MATGASTADAAIILVDARHGLTRQSRRHAYIAWLLGIRHLLIAVNKMDLVRFEPDAFERVRGAWDELAGKLPGASLHLLPISALDGDNVVTRSHRMPWYGGPSLLELLETIDAPAWNTGAPLRFPVQYVIRPNLDFRGYAGRIDSGTIRVGEYVTVQPSGKRSRVERIVTFDGDLEEAFAPMAVTLVLEDELDVGRGDWICAQDSRPSVSSRLDATLVWMHEKPLQPGAAVLLQQGATRVPARVQEILHRTDPETFEDQPARQLALNEIGLVRLETAHTLALDRYRDNRHTGSFVLIDRMENFTLGAGMVERMAAPELQSRCEAQVVIVRSEMLLVALERALFARGRAVAVFPRVPALAQLRDLAAHGLIALAQTPPADRDEAGLIEIAQTGTIRQSVDAALRELERRGLLPKEEN